MPPRKFLENVVILCFERRFSKQNSVIRLKSNILAPQIFWPLPNFRAGMPLHPNTLENLPVNPWGFTNPKLRTTVLNNNNIYRGITFKKAYKWYIVRAGS